MQVKGLWLYSFSQISWEGTSESTLLAQAGQFSSLESQKDSRLPRAWRLGFRPNLRQMHHDACNRISSDVVEERLLNEICVCKSLTAGASATGARVHFVSQLSREHEISRQWLYRLRAKGREAMESVFYTEEQRTEREAQI